MLFILVLLCPLATLFSILAYGLWRYGHWRRKGIPYVPPSFPFGNFQGAALLKENVGFTCKRIYDEGKGQPLVGYFVLIEPFLSIRDPALVRSVLVTRFDHFSTRSHVIPPDSVDSMMGSSIFGLPNQEWKCMRRNLTPCFAGAKLRAMLPMVMRCREQLMGRVEEVVEPKEGLLDVKDAMKRFQTDVICETLLGIHGDALSNENSVVYNVADELLESSWKRAFTTQAILFFSTIAKLFKLRFTPVSTEHFFYDVLQRNLYAKERGETTSDGNDATFGADFVDTLLRMREGLNDQNIAPLTDEKIMAQMGFFFLAGFETTSTTLTFCLFELSRHPTIQRRMAIEVDHVLGGNDWKLDYSCLNKMVFMEKVIQETLRKYPIVPLLSRQCVRDYPIPGSNWTIKKGTKVSVSVLGLHYDPVYFPEPTRFDPGRFEDSENAKRPPGCYIPYSIGPKACIGGQFAVISMKTVLAGILSKYEVHPSDSTPDVLPIDPYVFQFSPKGGVLLKFIRRHQNSSDSED